MGCVTAVTDVTVHVIVFGSAANIGFHRSYKVVKRERLFHLIRFAEIVDRVILFAPGAQDSGDVIKLVVHLTRLP